MLEVNIVMTAVIALYAVILHISFIRLKINILKLLEAIKKHDYEKMSDVWNRIVEQMTKCD